MTTVLMAVLAAIVIIVVAALALPVRLSLLAQSDPHGRVRIWARPFGGLSPHFPVVDTDRRDEKRAEKKRKKTAGKRRKKGDKQAGVRLAKNLPRLIKDLLRRVRVVRLDVDGVVGLGDPADTGALYGRLMPLIYGVPWPDDVHINVRPEFGDATLSGAVDAAADVTPAALVPPAVSFAWSTFGPGSSGPKPS